MLTGKHLIEGAWISSSETFESSTVDGSDRTYFAGSRELVDKAAVCAEAAFPSYSVLTRSKRGDFLRAIADEIDKLGSQITEIGTAETGLPAARLEGERGRTTGQLRLFADHIVEGTYLDRRHDIALPNRAPLPRPDLRLMQRPIGPVAVFGASNFPLAFSTAGGDTAAALAAGCPVVVKGHSAHPGTGELVARAIDRAIKRFDLHPGVFSLIQGGSREVGNALVRHPLIKAVGFTGSLGGGRALFNIAMSRPEPIPFYGELGSVNPMFVLPNAATKRGEEIGRGWAASLTLGVGQFCTNPGLAILLDDAKESFVAAALEGLQKVPQAPMLTSGMAQAFRHGVENIKSVPSVTELLANETDGRTSAPSLFAVSAETWLDNELLHDEVFGPTGIVVIAKDEREMLQVARAFEGQLTITLHLDDSDVALASKITAIAERKAGRVLCNGFPTGVEVCDAMVHGGPYPASTNFGATSVGTMSIRRFLRPVSYQNFPEALLPEDLRDL